MPSAYYRSRLSFDLTFFLLFVVIYVDRCQIYSSPDKANFLLQGISQRKTFKPRIGNCKGEEKDRLRLGYTAFVQHCLFLCALMCLLPPTLSFFFERNTVQNLVGNMRHASCHDPGIVNFLLKATDAIFNAHGDNNAYIIAHHLTPLIYMVFFTVVFGFLHVVFLGRFATLPLDIIYYYLGDMQALEPDRAWYQFLLDPKSPNPLRMLFPANGMCTLTFTAVSGERLTRTAMCSLKPNQILYIFALPIWTLLAVSILLALATAIFHLRPLFFPSIRKSLLKDKVMPCGEEDAKHVAQTLPYADFRFLLMLTTQLTKQTFDRLVLRPSQQTN